jgi:hypothetical protein
MNEVAFRGSAEKGHLEVVKYLVLKGANIYADDNFAFKCGTRKVVNYLESLKNNKEQVTDDSRWNCVCLNYHSPAYRGFNSFECSKGC